MIGARTGISPGADPVLLRTPALRDVPADFPAALPERLS